MASSLGVSVHFIRVQAYSAESKVELTKLNPPTVGCSGRSVCIISRGVPQVASTSISESSRR